MSTSKLCAVCGGYSIDPADGFTDPTFQEFCEKLDLPNLGDGDGRKDEYKKQCDPVPHKRLRKGVESEAGGRGNIKVKSNPSICDPCLTMVSSVMQSKTAVEEMEEEVKIVESIISRKLEQLKERLGGLGEDMKKISRAVEKSDVKSVEALLSNENEEERSQIIQFREGIMRVVQCVEMYKEGLNEEFKRLPFTTYIESHSTFKATDEEQYNDPFSMGGFPVKVLINEVEQSNENETDFSSLSDHAEICHFEYERDTAALGGTNSDILMEAGVSFLDASTCSSTEYSSAEPEEDPLAMNTTFDNQEEEEDDQAMVQMPPTSLGSSESQPEPANNLHMGSSQHDAARQLMTFLSGAMSGRPDWKQKALARIHTWADNILRNTDNEFPEDDPRRQYFFMYNPLSHRLNVGGIDVFINESRNSFDCTKCEFSSNVSMGVQMERSIFDHILGKHLKAYRCSLCKKALKTFGIYDQHLRKGHPPRLGSYSCQECKNTFQSDKLVKLHSLIFHKRGLQNQYT